MERAKKWLFIPWPLALVLSIVFGGGLVWIFLEGRETSWYAYIVFVGAFYALVTDCVLLLPRLVKLARARRPAKRETADPAQQLSRSLRTHLIVDLSYDLIDPRIREAR